MSELAVVSSKRIRLEKLSEHGSRGARAALALADSPSRFLSTVQVGITLIGIFNGAFGEASLVAKLSPHIASISGLAEAADEIALGTSLSGLPLPRSFLASWCPNALRCNTRKRWQP